MTDNFPDLSRKDIQAWVGSASYQKGLAYFEDEAIFEPQQQGMTLKARCLGNSAPFYQLEVTLDDDGIVTAGCSCPVGAGGYCKHVAALLLTWLDNPEVFEKSPDLEIALEERSKVELITLIRQMLQRYPDLEYLLRLPSPSADRGTKVIDPEIIRRQVSSAFNAESYDWDWRDSYETSRDLDELLNLAGQYQEQTDYGNAAIIYGAMLEEILDYEEIVIGDESGRFWGLIDDCIVGLGTCLEFTDGQSARQDILQTLFHVYLWDVNMGGFGFGDQIPGILLEQTTSDEKVMLSNLIEQALAGLRDWGREALGGLLLDLQAESLDDESFLEICRQTGRLDDLVARLLQLDRVDEAVNESEKAEDYRLLALADLFVQQGHDAIAEQMVRARAETSRDRRLILWLKENAIRQENLPEALELAKSLFWSQPSLPGYLDISKLADQMDQWVGLRSETLERLINDGNFGLLVEIYLEEGEIDLALDALERTRTSVRHWRGYHPSLELRVAEAAEGSRPEQAIRLYMIQIKDLIERRGRDNYAIAAGYLKKVLSLYQSLGREEDGRNLITRLRQENRNLPAFQDELKKAGM